MSKRYRKPKPKPPVKHDHYGHMKWRPTMAMCGKCGQMWKLREKITNAEKGEKIWYWELQPNNAADLLKKNKAL